MTPARLAGSAAWSVAGKLFQFLVGLVALALIARWVGPEAYGVFTLSWVLVGLVRIVVADAPTDTLVQRDGLRPGHCNASLLASLAIALLAWALISATADPVSSWLGGGAMLAAILPARAACLPLAAIASIPTALLMREQRFKALAGAEAIAGTCSSVTGIAAAAAGAGLWSLVIMELVREAVLLVLVLYLARWRPGIQARLADARELLGFNVATWGAWGLDYIDGQLPRVLIATALGAEALGFYALAERLFGQVSSILMVPAYQVLMPGMARVQNDLAAARRLAESILRGAAVAASPVFLGLAAIASPLVALVFGAEWLEAVPVVQILMLLGLWSSLEMVQIAVVRGLGRPGWHVAAAALQLALTTSLVLYALAYGLLAVVAALVIASLLMLLPYARMVQKLTGLGILRQASAITGPALAAAVMAAGTAGFVELAGEHLAGIVVLAAALPLGAMLYLASLRLFAPAAARFVLVALGALARGDIHGVRTLLAGDPASHEMNAEDLQSAVTIVAPVARPESGG